MKYLAAFANKEKRRYHLVESITEASKGASVYRRDFPDSSQLFFTMNKAVSAALLVIGLMLAIFGLIESESFSSSVSEFFTGTPTDRAMWMMIAGVALAIVGVFGISRGGKA